MTGSMQTFSIKDPSTVVSASQIVADNTGLQLEIGQGAVLQVGKLVSSVWQTTIIFSFFLSLSLS